jgi:hypothetical protein
MDNRFHYERSEKENNYDIAYKTVILLLFNCVYIQSMSMIRDCRLYIAYTCNNEFIFALCYIC